MPHHHHVDPHRLEIARGVHQRFPLQHGGTGGADVDGVGGKALFGELEGEIRVRVLFSKKALTIVFPRSTGTFLMRRSLISLKGSAVSRMEVICARERSSSARRSLPSAGAATRFTQTRAEAGRCRNGRRFPAPAPPRGPRVIRISAFPRCPHGSAARARHDPRVRRAVFGGAVEVRQLIQSGAHGAPGKKHIVHHHHLGVVDSPIGEAGFADHRPGADGHQIVPVKGDIQRAGRNGFPLVSADLTRDPLSQFHAPAMDADEHQVGGATRPLHDLAGDSHEELFGSGGVEKWLS